MERAALWVMLCGVLAVAMVGCGDEGGKRSDGGGDSAVVSPGEGDAGVGEDGGDGGSDSEQACAVFARMRKARQDGDSAAYAACFDADADCKAVLVKQCEMMKSDQDFEDAMLKQYGKDAFIEEHEAARRTIAARRDPEWRNHYRVEVSPQWDSNEWISITPKTDQSLGSVLLVQKDGAWLIQAPSYPPKEKFAESIRYCDAVMRVNKAAMKKIGEGYAPQRIRDEKGMEMAEDQSWKDK